MQTDSRRPDQCAQLQHSESRISRIAAEHRPSSTIAGGSTINFLVDLVVRSIITEASDLEKLDSTQNPLSALLSHTSISNGCVRNTIAHSVLLSFPSTISINDSPLFLPDVTVLCVFQSTRASIQCIHRSQ